MEEQAAARRRWIVIAAVAAAAIIAVVAWSVVAAGMIPAPAASPAAGPASSQSASPASTSQPSSPATPAATPPAPPVSAAPPASDAPVAPEAPPVDPTAPAEQAGVVVELVRVERVQGIAAAPGEISGPAVRLTVRVSNGGPAAIDAGLIVVNTYYGDARDPAPSIMQPGGEPFAGTIPPGGSAEGVYLFEGDDDQLADALVGVDAVPGQPTFTFRGDLR